MIMAVLGQFLWLPAVPAYGQRIMDVYPFDMEYGPSTRNQDTCMPFRTKEPRRDPEIAKLISSSSSCRFSRVSSLVRYADDGRARQSGQGAGRARKVYGKQATVERFPGRERGMPGEPSSRRPDSRSNPGIFAKIP